MQRKFRLAARSGKAAAVVVPVADRNRRRGGLAGSHVAAATATCCVQLAERVDRRHAELKRGIGDNRRSFPQLSTVEGYIMYIMRSGPGAADGAARPAVLAQRRSVEGTVMVSPGGIRQLKFSVHRCARDKEQLCSSGASRSAGNRCRSAKPPGRADGFAAVQLRRLWIGNEIAAGLQNRAGGPTVLQLCSCGASGSAGNRCRSAGPRLTAWRPPCCCGGPPASLAGWRGEAASPATDCGTTFPPERLHDTPPST
jgi:hypothetical protein